MSIVTNKELLDRAKAGHYAVAAFNTNNLEYTQAILRAAAELCAPVIIEAAKSEIDYMDGHVFVAMVTAMGAKLPIPIGIHLDHGPSYEEAVRCLNYGFKSVMYDGSSLPLEENIANTKMIVAAAHACGVSVEGEVGVIGQAVDGPEGKRNDMTGIADPDDCEKFVKETGVDCFAAAIGNAHGLYTRKPELRFGILEEIEKRTGIPLVLHGGTGIPQEDLRKAIAMGVSKINFSTVMRKGCIETLTATLNANPGDLDLMKMLTPAREKMVEIAKEHIVMCMSDHKA
ncbi:MAG: class II fructose-bisphosphate aldolase [Spirochaetaceae bacterium]|jgi:ketose-bisphosphate aldolase|nr:class II fructose-bisphosphate aldolase [Spirochaetaceae bacterium]